MNPAPAVYWRVRWAAYGAAAALALVALTWLLTTVVKSPQEALASAAPPPPSRITVPVEHRALDLRVRTTGRAVTRTTVRGTLSIDERDRVRQAGQIVVTGSGGRSIGHLKQTGPDGSFRLVLDSPVRAGPGRTVQVVFEPRNPTAIGSVVPISALFTSAAGKVTVIVVRAGQEHEVAVRMGDQAAGFVAVTPLYGDLLTPGDQVLVSEPTS